jgi:hypothetical protein
MLCVNAPGVGETVGLADAADLPTTQIGIFALH